MSPPSQRNRRVNAALRQHLAGAVRGLSDPRLADVTITQVEAAPDTTSARVYFVTLSTDARESALEALESARGALQGRIGAALRIRHTPHLVFLYDEHTENAERLTRLIDEVATSDDGTEE